MSIASRACTPFASLNNQLQHLNKELNRCETMSERITVREDIKLIQEELRSLETLDSKQQLQQISQNGSMNQIKIHYRLRDRAKPALCRKYNSEDRARQWLSELNSKPQYVLERVEGMKLL